MSKTPHVKPTKASLLAAQKVKEKYNPHNTVEAIPESDSDSSSSSSSSETSSSSSNSSNSQQNINFQKVVGYNTNQKSISKNLNSQKTKFLMSKYLPTEKRNKGGVTSMPVNMVKKKSFNVEKQTTIEQINQVKKPKPIQPSKSYYLNPQNKCEAPKVATNKFRRRMAVRVGNNPYKGDAENIGEVVDHGMRKSSTTALFQQLDTIYRKNTKRFKLRHANDMTFITSPKTSKNNLPDTNKKSKFVNKKSINKEINLNNKSYDKSDFSSVSSQSDDGDIIPETYKPLLTDISSKLSDEDFSSSMFSETSTTLDEREFDVILKGIL